MDPKTATNTASGPLRRSTRQGKVLSVEPTPRGPLKRTRKTSEHQSSSAVKGAKSVENGLDDEESPTKKHRLDTGEGDGDNLNDDNMEVQESDKEDENDKDVEMEAADNPLKETSRPNIYKDNFEDVNFSPRVVLHKPSQIRDPPQEESQGMRSRKESKAPPSHTKAHSHIRPPEKRPDVPITSMDEYNRKPEVKARSAASLSLNVPRANQIPQRAYPTSEEMYPARPFVNNIPANYLKKQAAATKTAGNKISSENSCRGFVWYLWRLVFLVLLSSATLLAYRILPVLQSKAGGGGGQQPREGMSGKFSNGLSLLQSQFPSQRAVLWERTKVHLEKHLKTADPTEPASLILVAGHKAERTLQCLAQDMASIYSSARNGSVLHLDGASKAGQDSDTVKLDIDNQLQAAFEGDKPVAVIHRVEELPPGSTLIFYRYCDHETAAYKQVFLLFTVLLPQDEISSEMSLIEVEEMVLNYIKEKLVNSESEADFNEMDVDKFSGLWSRISHVVLPVVLEEEVEQEGCP
ncbi:torsin-1A-interacting protein 1-like isoform X2 [Girardinichthys multiradiatus]|uniref:torsin-1A-interacting protein 1-like isoform X2 n=1 Tax=Girardinichthys multiradiatus TaxID=208333 RepID=UPI001FADC4A9|nr:torsin-1A-interacting protein 1-like isoform X2 [Girardinichthys multiradiatus]